MHNADDISTPPFDLCEYNARTGVDYSRKNGAVRNFTNAINRFGLTKRSPATFRGNSQANTKSHSGGLWELCKGLFGRCGTPTGNWATLAGNEIVAQPQLGTS